MPARACQPVKIVAASLLVAAVAAILAALPASADAAALNITTASLASGTDGASYSQALSATGGTPPYKWNVTSGDLPRGLALGRATGVVSGTIYAPGTANITVTVSDSAASPAKASKDFAIAVSAADTDGDSLPDGWEMEHFGNLNQNDTGDPDSDGYSNLAEYNNGTDPAAAETMPPYYSTAAWQSVGLDGGGAQYNPTPAPNNPRLMFGACDMGGFYRSTDGGRHWRMVNGTYVNGTPGYRDDDCGSEFDPQDENIALASRSMGLARTADGGLTWTRVSSVEPTALAFHGRDGSLAMFAGQDNKVYKSTDAGATWVHVTGWESVGVKIRELFIDASTPASNPTVYVSTAQGVYKSTNGGANWTAKNSGLAATNIVDMDAGMKGDTMILYALANSVVYKTSNGGDAWTAVMNGLPATWGSGTAVLYGTVGVCATNPDVAYVGSNEYYGPTIYRTSDGGANWTVKLIQSSAPNFPPTTVIERDWMTLAYGWGWGEDAHQVVVCPTDPNVVAFSEDGRTWRSDDGGDRWFCVNGEEAAAGTNWWKNTGFGTTTCYHYDADPRDPARRYICYTDIGFARSEDADATWRWSANGSPWKNTFYEIACDPTAPGRIWAAASNKHDLPQWSSILADPTTFTGGIVTSADWGTSWTDLGHSTGLPTGAATSIIVDPASPEANRTLYAVIFAKGVYKSTDGGAHWTAKNTGLSMPNNNNVWRLARASDGTLYCAITHRMDNSVVPRKYYKGGLFRSTNGGDSWTLVNTTTDLIWIVGFSIDPTDPDKIYVGCDNAAGGLAGGGVWRTTDGGATWQRVLDEGDTWNVVPDPQRPSRLWAGVLGEYKYEGNGVYMSEDGGDTWLRSPTFPFTMIGGYQASFDPADSQTVYFTTYGGGVFKGFVPHADPPAASFTATPASGNMPLEVQFDPSASTGDVTTWTWSFGDGSSSHAASPKHTFASAGTFTVKLTVEGRNGTSSTTRTVTVIDADTDHDGLPDWWEQEYFGNLGQTAAGDYDGDGYSNLAEYINGTDPTVPDAVPPYLSTVEWTSVGAGGGGAQYSPTPAPNNPDLMFGNCDMGGFYRSTDGGRHWRMVDGDYVNLMPSYRDEDCGPEFDPADENILLVPRNRGLVRSTDAGLTFTKVSDVEPTAIAFHAGSPNVCYFAGQDDKLYKSTDTGATWTEVPGWRSVGVRIRELFADASSSASSPTLYASTGQGVYKSANGGATWSAKNTGLGSLDIIDMDAGMKAGSIVLYAVTGNSVYKSADGAGTWNASMTRLPGGYYYGTVGVCATNPDVAYVGSNEDAGPTIYKTSDGGAHWVLKLIDPSSPSLPPSTTVERDWMTIALGWGWGEDAHQLCVSPTDPNVVAFAEDGRTWRSDNGGDHWFCCNNEEKSLGSNWWKSTGYEVTNAYGYYVDPRDANRHYICYTDMGFARSEDAGASWRWSAAGSPWRNTFYGLACDPTVPGCLWAVASNNHDLPHHKMLRQNVNGFSGGVLVSNDWGATWTDLGHSTGLPTGAATSVAVDPTSPEGARTLWVTVLAKGVYKSTDGGATWTAKNTGLGMPNNMNAWQIVRMGDGTLYVSITLAITGVNPDFVYYKGGLFKSANGGDSWSLVNTGQDLPWIVGFAVDPNDQNRIYVGCFNTPGGVGLGGGWRTTDGGAAWQRVLDRSDVWKITIDPGRPARLWAGVQADTTWWSDDAYTSDGLAISEDGGDTWRRMPTFPFRQYGAQQVLFDPEDSQNVFVTTFGGGVWKARVPYADAPTASFTATPESGTIPLQVEFDSSASTGDITLYTWTFGDGSVSHEANPSHTYAAAGTFTVTLKVEGRNGIATASKDVRAFELDSDGDGLPDWWEIENFGDLDENASGDYDGDGITNGDEYARGTDPTEVDAAGPSVSSLATLPNAVREGVDATVTLTGLADDTATGNSRIAAAEYFVGAAGAAGSGTSMQPADGAWSSSSEPLTATINCSRWKKPSATLFVRARDVLGFWGAAELLSVAVVDGVPPAAANDLSIAPSMKFDRLTRDEWITPGSVAPGEETIVIDLGGTHMVGAVSLRPSAETKLFPNRFTIYGSADGEDWTTLAGAIYYKAASGAHLWQNAPASYRYVKVAADTRFNPKDAHFYVKVAEACVYETTDSNKMTATWHATADDGGDPSSGAASIYDLRYSGSLITPANFSAATRVTSGLAAPRARGAVEQVDFPVGILTGKVYVALKIGDEVPNWSAMSNVAAANVAAAGLSPVYPDDAVSITAGDSAMQFGFVRGVDMKSTYIAFSDRPDFPAATITNFDGTQSKSVRFALFPGSLWKPNLSQWKSIKMLAARTGTVYWRLEGKNAAYAAVFGPARSIFFQTGAISDLAVSPSHPAGPDEAAWPGLAAPQFSWTDGTLGMRYFYVDVSSDARIPLRQAAITKTLARAGVVGVSQYAPTAPEWKKVRQIANKSGGVLYWRVRAVEADRALSCASAVKTLVIDGGLWAVGDLDLAAPSPSLSWTHAGEGIAKYSLQFSLSSDFLPGARETLKVPAASITATTYNFTAAEVARLKHFAAKYGEPVLYYRVRGEDADRAFYAPSPSKTVPMP